MPHHFGQSEHLAGHYRSLLPVLHARDRLRHNARVQRERLERLERARAEHHEVMDSLSRLIVEMQEMEGAEGCS